MALALALALAKRGLSIDEASLRREPAALGA
jgi:hypothetical protein